MSVVHVNSISGITSITTPSSSDVLTLHTSNNAERLRIDSSGRLLLGTTTEGFASYGDKFTIANSGHCGMTIRSGDTSDGNIYFSDGTSGADEVRGFVEYNHNGNTMNLGTNGGWKLRIDSSGHVGLGIAPSDVDSIGKALNIASSTGGAIYLQDTDAPTTKFAAISYNGGTAALQIHAHHGASTISLGTDGTERVHITSGGNMRLQNASANGNFTISRNASVTSTNTAIGVVDFACNTAHTVQARLMGKTLGTSNVGGDLVIETRANGGSLDERVRFTGEGEVLIGRSAWGSNLHPNDINKLVVTGTSPADAYDSQCYLEGSETSGAVNTGGALAFGGHDGSSHRNWANIYGMKENGTGGNTAAYMSFHTRPAGGGPTERLRITSGGIVNIGGNFTQTTYNASITTGSVNKKISFGAAAHNDLSNEGAAILFSRQSDGAAEIAGIFGHGNTSLGIAARESLTFHAGGTSTYGAAPERLRIRSTGQVDFASRNFTMGTQSDSGASTGITGNAWSNNEIGIKMSHRVSGGQSFFVFYNTNGQVGYIQSSGSGTIYNTGSDYRLKENQVLISDGITRLKQLKPYRFNFKKDPSTTLDGFFAHEVQSVVPEAIAGTKDEVATKDEGDRKIGDPILQGMDYGRITPLLTAALQEAISKIEVLEAKVAALESA